MKYLVFAVLVACVSGAPQPLRLPRWPLGPLLRGDSQWSQSRVIGGEEIEPNQYPFLISLQRLSFSWTHLCAGSIYNERWIIFNAHCNEGIISLESLRVDAGEHSFSLPSGFEETRSVTQLIIHPDYNATTLENDIALIQMSSPLDFGTGKVSPIALPAQGDEYADGTSVTVVGWGLLASDGTRQDKPHEAQVQVVNDGDCNVSYLDGDYIKASMLCAGVPEGGKGPCQGDWGGPLFTTDRPYVLVGISSWGYPGCAATGYPDVYTQVSYYVDWIRSVVSPSTV